MPSYTIDNVFIELFRAEVFEAYQRESANVRARVQVQTDVRGTQTTFNKGGAKGEPRTKGMLDDVPTEATTWSRVPCILEQRYLGEPVKTDIDLFTNVAEREHIVNQLAKSFARYEDDLILKAATTTTNAANNTATDDGWADDSVALLMLETFGGNSAFKAGEMYAMVTWTTWAKLLKLATFTDVNVGGDPGLTRAGVAAKMFYGFAYLPYEGMPFNSGNSGSKLNLWWHKPALGLAVSQEVERHAEYLPGKDANLLWMKCMMGAVLIDATGVVKRRVAS